MSQLVYLGLHPPLRNVPRTQGEAVEGDKVVDCHTEHVQSQDNVLEMK